LLTEKETKLLKALSSSVTVSFKDQPLQAVIAEFERRHGIAIDVDRAALAAAGLNMQTPASVNAREQSLRALLKKMLGELGMTFIIQNGELTVTTPERANQMFLTRAYYLGDLAAGTGFTLEPFTTPIQAVQTIAALIYRIQSIEPTSWEFAGGPGLVGFDPLRMAIIIKQSAEMHFLLQGHLREPEVRPPAVEPSAPAAEPIAPPVEVLEGSGCRGSSRRVGPIRRLFRR
jgi:hypothetical protein